jgi:chitinase
MPPGNRWNKKPIHLALAMVLLFGGALCSAQGFVSAEHPIVVGYFVAGSIHKRFFVKNLISEAATQMLDQINYSQGHIKDNQCVIADANEDLNYVFSPEDSVDGTADFAEMPLRGNFHQLQELKRLYPQIKILISLEGNASSFAEAAQPANMFSFVTSCIQTFIEGKFADGVEAPGLFDGVDIDWEYPGEVDKYNFLALLAEFRQQLDAAHPDLLLSVAMGDFGASYQHLDMETVALYVDQVGVMNYDYDGPWSTVTGLVAPLYSSPGDPEKNNDVASTIRGYEKAGVPESKILMGLPFYAYSWNKVWPANHGLFQFGEPSHADVPYSYIPTIQGKFTLYRDPNSLAPWLFDGLTFWTYDDEVSIAAKLEYAKEQGLGGVMIWELSGDTSDGRLLRTISEQFRNQQFQDQQLQDQQLQDQRRATP